MGPRAGLDVLKKRNLCGDSNPVTSIPYLVAIIDYAAHEFTLLPFTIHRIQLTFSQAVESDALPVELARHTTHSIPRPFSVRVLGTVQINTHF